MTLHHDGVQANEPVEISKFTVTHLPAEAVGRVDRLQSLRIGLQVLVRLGHHVCVGRAACTRALRKSEARSGPHQLCVRRVLALQVGVFGLNDGVVDQGLVLETWTVR